MCNLVLDDRATPHACKLGRHASRRLARQLRAAGALVALLVPLRAARADPPANDEWQTATEIPGLPYTTQLDIGEATASSADPPCGGFYTVWFVFKPQADVYVWANALGSDYNTMIGVYDGTPGPDTEIQCNDDVSEEIQTATAEFVAEAGTTYYFMLSAVYLEQPGTLVFNLSAAPHADVAIDPFGSVDIKAGTVDVSGTAYCSEPLWGFFAVGVRQKVGQHDLYKPKDWVEGFACDGDTTWSSLDLGASNGLFKGGKATVEVELLACNEVFQCVSATAEHVAKLLPGK